MNDANTQLILDAIQNLKTSLESCMDALESDIKRIDRNVEIIARNTRHQYRHGSVIDFEEKLG